jgi:predicted RNA polymerase sigma factor
VRNGGSSRACYRSADHGPQVVALYDQLVRLDPSPITALNRAVAVAELDGPEVALAAVDRLEGKLAGYHAYHATRADLLRRLGRSQQSRAAYDKAIELAGQHRRGRLPETPPRPAGVAPANPDRNPRAKRRPAPMEYPAWARGR